jgi:hypothetical protein
VSLTVTNSNGSDTENKVGYMQVTEEDYCEGSSASTSYEYMSSVVFGTINNLSENTSYSDFTSENVEIEMGSSESLTVTLVNGYSSDQVLVWVDWNQDSDFEDVGENVFASSNGVGPFTTDITVPLTALVGSTRMRIRLYDTASSPNDSPCGESGYGEVEDYTITVSNGNTVVEGIVIEDINGIDVSGATLTVSGTISDAELLEELHIKNSSNSDMEIKVTKIENGVISGTSNYYCWGLCYTPAVYTSPMGVTVLANSTNSDDFSAHYTPNGNAGITSVTYQFFDVNNPTETAEVTINFEVTPLTSSDQININKLQVYPNPSDGIIRLTNDTEERIQTIEVFDVAGKLVQNYFHPEKNIELNLSQLGSGVYYVKYRFSAQMIVKKISVVR